MGRDYHRLLGRLVSGTASGAEQVVRLVIVKLIDGFKETLAVYRGLAGIGALVAAGLAIAGIVAFGALWADLLLGLLLVLALLAGVILWAVAGLALNRIGHLRQLLIRDSTGSSEAHERASRIVSDLSVPTSPVGVVLLALRLARNPRATLESFASASQDLRDLVRELYADPESSSLDPS